MATAIAAVRSAVTFLAISLYVLILAPPGLLVAMLFKWPGMLYDTGRFGVWLGIVLAGIRREGVQARHAIEDPPMRGARPAEESRRGVTGQAPKRVTSRNSG